MQKIRSKSCSTRRIGSSKKLNIIFSTFAINKSLKKNQLQGTWYKLGSTPIVKQPLSCDRVTTIYNPLNNSLINTGYLYAKKGAPEHLEYSQIISQGPDGTYKVQTNIPANVDIGYYEILTDYSDYSISYACIYVDGKYARSKHEKKKMIKT